MKENELRIGNKVHHTNFFVRTISSIRTNSTDTPLVRFANSGGEYSIDKIYPIPLTEEILLKCKGVKSSYTSNPELIGASKKYNLGSIIIFQQNEDESVFYTCINEDMDNLIVDTLHQLQNLYFALTGQELEINL